MIVAMILALAARRSNALLISHAGIERERTNLARYFSPNVVEELSKNDEPLKQVRTQDVAVLFADIVGFTAYSDGRSPTEVIGTLRRFHERMEREVFRHDGTLDKYLGDGLMATFGTPFTGDCDAGNALRCAQAMIGSMDELNLERKHRGEPPIQLSLGLHYGPVVLGDIGLNRLEFAVIGTTVNAASRLEVPHPRIRLRAGGQRRPGAAGTRGGQMLERRLHASGREAGLRGPRHRATRRDLDAREQRAIALSR